DLFDLGRLVVFVIISGLAALLLSCPRTKLHNEIV
ncbi:MAG: hypothetical protein ACI9UK_001097, partial [Candidatus Krumholzibacteriia bacterium]